MPTVVDVVRSLCNEKNIPVSKLERALDFGNGYLNPKKISSITSDRLVKIADYLGVSVEEILSRASGAKTTKSPASGSDPETGLDENQRSMLAIYDSLPPDKQAIMLELGKAFLSQANADRKDAQ